MTYSCFLWTGYTGQKKKNEVQSNQEFWQQYNEHVLEDTADLCL